MKRGFLTLALAAGVMTGCTMTPDECDPSVDPGFLNKLGCTVSGSYSQRVEDKQAAVDALKAENEQLKQQSQELLNEQVLVDGNVAERRAQIAKMQSELSEVKSAVAKKGAMSDELKSKIAEAEQQLAEMQNTNTDNTPLLQKQQQLDELKTTYDELIVLSGQ